jgi:hypothetical protein
VPPPIETTVRIESHVLHPGEPIKPESVSGIHTGEATGSVLGGAAGGHDTGAFTDLIRLAQNPVQSGLVPPAASTAHDAISALQLSALGDHAGNFGAPHDDGAHMSLSTFAAAVNEDHSHLAAPAIDHGHSSH